MDDRSGIYMIRCAKNGVPAAKKAFNYAVVLKMEPAIFGHTKVAVNRATPLTH
jgi:hypothetical protein